MLSVIDIIRALSLLIEEKFPDFPVVDRDLTEGFPRPCYFIDVEGLVTENLTNRLIKETADIEISYFAEDIYEGFLRLLEVNSELVAALTEPLPITDMNGETVAHVVFNDVRTEIIKADKSLTFSMTTELIQGVPDGDTHPLIDTVEFEVGVNK